MVTVLKSVFALLNDFKGHLIATYNFCVLIVVISVKSKSFHVPENFNAKMEKTSPFISLVHEANFFKLTFHLQRSCTDICQKFPILPFVRSAANLIRLRATAYSEPFTQLAVQGKLFSYDFQRKCSWTNKRPLKLINCTHLVFIRHAQSYIMRKMSHLK